MSSSAEKRRNIRYTVFALAGVIALLVSMFVRQFVTPGRIDPEWLKLHQTMLYDTPRRYSPLELVDQHGKPFDGAAFKGTWSVVFFGFTFCPDVCPTTMTILRDVQAGLDAPADGRLPVRFYFASVDPARDTPAQLDTYVSHFGKEFTGLTGEFLDVARFAGESGIAFQKVVGKDGAYSVDHSANLALVNPHGDYVGFIMPPFDTDRLVRVLERLRTQAQ